jgi:Acyl-CoA carboxylase epsilon subunit
MNTPSDSRDPAIADERPLLRVVKGEPTAEELAALVAVVAARRAGGQAPPPRRRPVWGHPAAAVRREHRAGPGAWRASGLPR